MDVRLAKSGLSKILPLDTSRLRIREFKPWDAEDLYELHRDCRVTRHAGGVKSKKQSGESLRRIMNRTRPAGFGALALEHCESGDVIGWCGVQRMPSTELYEVIYALRRQSWGQGFASEAAEALMREAFMLEDLAITDLYALVYPQNIRSILVLERLGMTFVENRLDETAGRHACLYRVSKEDFMRLIGASRVELPYSSLSK